MPMAAQAAVHVDVFDAAREELEVMICKLRGGGVRAHTEVIGELRQGGAEVQRRLLQGWLDQLLQRERAEVPSWAVPEGSRVRERERRLEMEFGRVRVRRHGITLPGETEAKFPMDSQLNLPPEIYALTLREQVADAAVEASFDRSVARVDRATAGHVPKRQAEQQVIRAAADFETFYKTRTPPANDALSAEALQVMSSDGKGVTMRPEGLRDATRKAAEEANADAIRGDPMAERKARRSDKRMAVVTAVWEQEPHVRTARDVLERLHRDPEGRKRRPRSDKAPRPQNKHVAASLTKLYADGVAEMFDEAQRRNLDGERRNVALLDGDEKQIEYVEAEAKKRRMSVTVVLDLIHVIHYLWTTVRVRTLERGRAGWSTAATETPPSRGERVVKAGDVDGRPRPEPKAPLDGKLAGPSVAGPRPQLELRPLVGDDEVLVQASDLLIVLELHAAILLLGALARHLHEELRMHARLGVVGVDFVRAIHREVRVIADPALARGQDTKPLIGSLEDAGAAAEGRPDRVVEAAAEHVVAPGRARHRDDLAIDQLVALPGLPLEAKVFREVHGPARWVGDHEWNVAPPHSGRHRGGRRAGKPGGGQEEG
jgi:hypothetical protein